MTITKYIELEWRLYTSLFSSVSDVSLTVVVSAVPASLLFLLLFIAILLLSMILLSIRRDKRLVH